MLVDDDPLAIEVARDALVPRGHEVIHAGDWADMTAILTSRPVGVMLLDVHLPGVTGDALIAQIREILSQPPRILLYSGMEEADLRRLARTTRADGFLKKGCSAAEMVAAVEALILDDSLPPRQRRVREPGGGEAVASVPRARTPAPRGTRVEAGAPAPGGSPDDGWRPRLLVIDDSRLRMSILVDSFTRRGFQPRTAPDGRAALLLLESMPDAELPELIVSDVSMPNLSGIEFTQAVRRNERYDSIPVILYTTTASVIGDTRKKLEVLEAGASEYLRGAVSFEMLSEAVARRIEALRAIRSLEASRRRKE